MSASKWTSPKLAVAELPDWKLEDKIAELISLVPIQIRDFLLLCGMIEAADLTNEQRLFLLRLAVAPDESAK